MLSQKKLSARERRLDPGRRHLGRFRRGDFVVDHATGPWAFLRNSVSSTSTIATTFPCSTPWLTLGEVVLVRP